MIEDIGDVENKINDIQENRESDSIEISNQMGNGIHNCEGGLANSSSLSEGNVNVFHQEMLKDASNFHGEKLSLPKEEAHMLSQCGQIPEVNVMSSDSQSTSDRGVRCPSPLLFTPVKGEETYGAGLLSQRVHQVTPTSAGEVTSTPKNLPPRFCTPSPIKKSVTGVDCSGLVFSVGMKRSSQHWANDGHDESNHSSTSSDHKLKHSRSEYIISPDKHSVSPTHNPQNLFCKKFEPLLISSSPSHSVKPDLKATAAQIDSSPSPSECSDSSLFVTPKREDRIKAVTQQQKLVYQNNHTRTKRKHRIRTLVSRARHLLSGIPPPPSFTIPQISVDEMLSKLGGRSIYVNFCGHAGATLCCPANNSISSVTIDSPSIPLEDGTQCNIKTNDITSSIVDDVENTKERTDSILSYDSVIEKDVHSGPSPNIQTQMLPCDKGCESLSLFHPSASEKEIIDMPWPAVLDCVHLGLCYNLGTSSEALEELCQQVREKYVGNETASSCTIWSVSNTSKRSSPRLRKNSNSQANMQGREGYMMRRRRAFSLASLSSSIPSMATKSRQILVNRVTKLSAESKKPKNVTEDKGRLMVKEGLKISLLKKVFDDQGGNSNKLKRSYSFNDSSGSDAQLSSSSASESSFFSQSSSKLMSTKRVLKFDRLPRAASSPSLDASSSKAKLNAPTFSSQRSCDNIASVVNKDLSEVYKKKLLWAVAEALRSRGLGTGHENFKPCAIPLFRRCRDAFIALPSSDASAVGRSCDEYSIEKACEIKSNSSTDSQKERTSDKMLNIALQLVDQVMNEVGVVPVIKDKCGST